MANSDLHSASCALLLLLLTLGWRASTGVPVPDLSTEKCEQCSLLFRSLLLNFTDLLNSSKVCFGITSNKVVLKSKAQTLLTCTPTLSQNQGCLVQGNSSFNESECLRNIMKDLAHYDTVIQSYIKSSLRNPEEEVPPLNQTLGIIQSLRKNCAMMTNGEDDSAEEVTVPVWGSESFINRQDMCNMLRGFYVRTITINRAMGYISSGDHRK
uniref:interleukin-12 subunit alpha n=1 Tax=Monopterus albus TaxID=43700 RepID=UPI0009B36C1B|nr:interleukin-12 subunit alpha-like [Monopterus albus]